MLTFNIDMTKTLIYILFVLIVLILLYHRNTNNIVGYWRKNSDGTIYHIEKISYRTFKSKDKIGSISFINQINYEKNKGYIFEASILWDNGEVWDYQSGR